MFKLYSRRFRIAIKLLTVVFVISACGIMSAVMPATVVNAATSYYVSYSGGNDNNDGLSSGTPWKTLAKASSISYAAGDTIYLKRGDSWNETLTINGGGSSASPITVTAYGSGLRPYINRNDADNSKCIVLNSAQGVKVSNIEMGYAMYGIYVFADPAVKSTFDYFYFQNCYFHHIRNLNWSSGQPEGKSICFYRNVTDGPSVTVPNFKNITVINCFSDTSDMFIGHANIGATQYCGCNIYENVLVTGCTVIHGSFTQVVQAHAKNYDITNCMFAYNVSRKSYPSGTTDIISAWDDGTASIQNDVTGNELGWRGEYPGNPDGCAYDFEASNNYMNFQNNYVHNTWGESILFMGGFNQGSLTVSGNKFRNNVAYNTNYYNNIQIYTNLTGGGSFYNNSFYNRTGVGAFYSYPSAFTYSSNDQDAAAKFVAMPMVTNITTGSGTRIYTLACTTPGATIRYTTNGSVPTSSSTAYSSPITVSDSCSINAKAFKSGCNDSYTNAIMVNLRDSETSGPTSWWKLDETSGTTAVDSAGYNNGTLTSSPQWVGGAFNNCLKFDGTDDTVNISQTPYTSISDSFTQSLWVCVDSGCSITLNSESTSGYPGTAGQKYAVYPSLRGGTSYSSHSGMGISVGTNGVSVYEHSDGYLPTLLTDNQPLATGWHLVTVVYKAKQPFLYIDGVFRKAGMSSPKTIHPSGTLGGGSYGYFKGWIDDARIYNRPLTDAEIQKLYNNSALGRCKIVSKLRSVMLWETDETYNGNYNCYNVSSVPISYNDDADLWQLVYAGGGYYKIVNMARNEMLWETNENYNGGANNYCVCTVPVSASGDAGLWSLTDEGGGYHTIVSKLRAVKLWETNETYNGVTGCYNLCTVPTSVSGDAGLWSFAN